MLTHIAVIALVTIAFSFYLSGCIQFGSRLTLKNSISTYGMLVGFREYNRLDTSSNSEYSSQDYLINKAGRVPVVRFSLDGEELDFAAEAPNDTLTKDDIGKQVRIRYKRGFGITMMIDDEKGLKKYNQLQCIVFWILIGIATIFLLMIIPAYLYLPIWDSIPD